MAKDHSIPGWLCKPKSARQRFPASVLFDILAGAFRDTALEPDLDELFWHVTDLFHKKAARAQRQLEGNEDRQRKSQDEQDGSEVRSVELQSLLGQGQSLIERREAFEHIRDLAAERYEAETGSVWRPRAGSLVSHKHLTAAMIDSRDFLAAGARPTPSFSCPKARRSRFPAEPTTPTTSCIWSLLDKVFAKHPDMVLIHGGTPKGAEKAAACWADHRKVTQIAFKHDWTRDGKAAPFKRNDRCSTSCPWASSSSPAPASPAISPTRRRSSAFPFWITGRAARKRRLSSLFVFEIGRLRSAAARVARGQLTSYTTSRLHLEALARSPSVSRMLANFTRRCHP